MNRTSAAFIVLIGFQFRSIVLAVPPALPDIRSALHLSFSATGALTAIPVLGLGAAAIPGAILVNRFGARRVVGMATLGLGLAAILRMAPPLPYSLFGWTAVLATFVAIAQPAMSVTVRTWFPDRIQQASTVYAMSLALGGLTAASLTVYLLPVVGWRGTFAVWGLPAIVAAGLWLRLGPGRSSPHEPQPHDLGALLRSRQVWHVAALFGGQSLVFYGGVAWIPFLLRGTSAGYLALVLLLFQAVSLPLTVIASTNNRPWATSRWWYVTGGIFMMIGTVGFTLGVTDLAWLWAPITGLGNSMVFLGALSLPAILARHRNEVAGYTAITLTAGYALAFLGPLAGGLILDLTGVFTSPFWIYFVAAVITTALAMMISRSHHTAQALDRNPTE